MAVTKQQTDLLQKEETFLKDLRTKLTDQLNRLKVEEIALLNLRSLENEQQLSTVQHFARQDPNALVQHEALFNSSATETEQMEEPSMNLTPLTMLQPITRCEPVSDEEEEEEEEYFEEQDADEDSATSSLLNPSADFAVSRHVLQQVLKEQLADELDSDEDS